ncbi:hypothetical protein NHQ30_004221 [Ciborinia camelliae]|nr:hypothetical protein NHQ30_004221 [Ciborinia camelliae]
MNTPHATMNSSSAPVLSNFPKFPLLPREIQIEIWYHALPEGQLVYHDPKVSFPPQKPHALYYASHDSREMYLKHYKNIYTHDSSCRNHARQQEFRSFFNPKDTVLCEIAPEAQTPGHYLLLFGYRICCQAWLKRLLECHHIAIIADRKLYKPISGHDFLTGASTRSGMSVYEQFVKIFTALESISFVVGCETIKETAEMFPEMRLAKSLRGSGRKNQATWKLIMEDYYADTVNLIRDGFEREKERQPNVKFPRIELVIPTSREY